MSQAPVVVFDLDDTLTQKDTLLPFLRSLNSLGVLKGLTLSSPWLVSSVIARNTRDRAKAILVGHAIRGLRVDSVIGEADRYVPTVALNPRIIEKLQHHRDHGHTLVIATAAPRFLADAFGRMLDIDLIIGTEMVAVEGTYTGDMVGNNVRADEKAKRVRQRIGRPPDVAYGNLPDDEPMLRLAAQGFVVANGVIGPLQERSA